jgi:glycosyltransferase involved in cell wall biosynthesis
MTKCIDIVITFHNAQEFVDDAFNGILIQNTDLINKIVIINDFSKDNTNDKILTWIKNLPSFKIEYLNNSKNIGTFSSLNLALSKCSAQFVAVIEGDDYWIDSNKLVMQLEVLKADLRLSGVGGNSKIVSNDNTWVGGYYSNHSNGKLYFKDLVGPPPFQLSTLLFRRKLLPLLPDLFSNTICNDKLIYSLLSLSGPIFYSESLYSTYRLNNNGISLSTGFRKKFDEQKKYYQKLSQFLNGKYDLLISKAVFIHLKGFFIETKTNRIKNEMSIKEIFKIWISAHKVYSPKGIKELFSIIILRYF